MRLEIEVGQKAVAVESNMHSFKNGEEIKFVHYGHKDEDQDYYEYVFYSELEGFHQWLESNEFKLLEHKEVE